MCEDFEDAHLRWTRSIFGDSRPQNISGWNLRKQRPRSMAINFANTALRWPMRVAGTCYWAWRINHPVLWLGVPRVPIPLAWRDSSLSGSDFEWM